jgi:hypothetical protein
MRQRGGHLPSNRKSGGRLRLTRGLDVLNEEASIGQQSCVSRLELQQPLHLRVQPRTSVARYYPAIGG